MKIIIEIDHRDVKITVETPEDDNLTVERFEELKKISDLLNDRIILSHTQKAKITRIYKTWASEIPEELREDFQKDLQYLTSQQGIPYVLNEKVLKKIKNLHETPPF